ncbi:hypothetical protein BDK51DRAFT_27748, partial [Blyttiomyces helicus]
MQIISPLAVILLASAAAATSNAPALVVGGDVKCGVSSTSGARCETGLTCMEDQFEKVHRCRHVSLFGGDCSRAFDVCEEGSSCLLFGAEATCGPDQTFVPPNTPV